MELVMSSSIAGSSRVDKQANERARKRLRERLRDVGQEREHALAHIVTLEAQGSVLVVTRALGAPGGTGGGGTRGKVCGFSKASRKRLLEKLGRLSMQGQQVKGHRHVATFVTLTYPGDENTLPSPKRCKEDGRAFLERLRRRFPKASGMWRFEHESEGQRDYHPHLHLLLFGLPFVDKKVIQEWWSEIIGRPRPFTRIESVRSQRGVMHYAAKYAAKVGSGLDYLAYPHATLNEETGEIEGEDMLPDGRIHTGRVWGVFNRDFLPYAELVECCLTLGRWFFDMKRKGREVWEGVNTFKWAGFTLFVDDPGAWLRWAEGASQGEERLTCNDNASPCTDSSCKEEGNPA
jgi:hypothetical protein